MSWSILPSPILQPETTELDVLRYLDRAIGRALVDRDFAVALLADPGEAIERDDGCPVRCPALSNIHASSVQDFAAQALAVLSPSVHRGPDSQVRGAT